MSAQSTGKEFVSALARQDFGKLERLLHPEVRFRAMLPPGPFEWTGATAAADNFRSWFGEATEFQILHSEVATIARRLRISYRFRLQPHPFIPGSGWHVIEQQVFCDVHKESIKTIDLLCSGFQPEAAVA